MCHLTLHFYIIENEAMSDYNLRKKRRKVIFFMLNTSVSQNGLDPIMKSLPQKFK